MLKINEMLLKLEGFKYTTSPDLSIGYYYLRLRDNKSTFCTIIIPWWKYCYKCLPMIGANSPNIFQQKMNDLFHGFEFIYAYIYELLVFTKGDWTGHVQKL